MENPTNHNKRFIAVIDTNVLYKGYVRDLILRFSELELYRVKWSKKTLDELHEVTERNGLDVSKMNKTIALMNEFFPDALVTGYEELEVGLTLPDSDDKHVLASAIMCGADVIVTENLRDFPNEEIYTKWRKNVQHPDNFLTHVLGLDAQLVAADILEMLNGYKNPPMNIKDFYDMLERNDLFKFGLTLRDYL